MTSDEITSIADQYAKEKITGPMWVREEVANAYRQGRADALKELEQREREFYQAGQDSIVVVERTSYNDYLKQRNREQALSELVADGEKNGDYDDHLKQRKES